MLPFKSNQELAIELAHRCQQKRLAANFSRKTLAQRSGVSEASIKRFETTGEIALMSLLSLAITLECTAECETLFQPKETPSIADILQKQRQRGRR